MKQHAPGFLRLVDEARARIREVTAAEVKGRLAEGARIELVDVREDREWDASRARGARHIGKGVIERDIETLVPDKDRELVLYCGGGYRSALAADALQQMGYVKVASLAGGFRAWKATGGPVDD